MSRKVIIIAVIIISMSTALTTAMIILTLLSNKKQVKLTDNNSNIETVEKEKLNSNSYYDINADISLTENRVNIREDIAIKHRDKKVYLYLPSVNAADTKIIKAASNKEAIKIIRHQTMLEIDCTAVPDKINIEYEICLKQDKKILSYSGSSVYLGDFLVTPAVYNGGEPVLTYKSAFGDPYVYGMLNYHVTFRVGSSMNIYAPGEKEEHSFGANKTTEFKAAGIRDFSAVIVKGADIKLVRSGSINIYFINSYKASEYVQFAFNYAQKMIGPYPYKDLYVVKMPLFHEGMEFSNMIFLSDSCFENPDTLKRVSYHEVFHQWFYGIIGTDQLNEPYLDEGLAGYLSGLLSGSTFSGDGSRKFTQMRLRDYAFRQEYYKIAYYNSAFYFYNLHKKMGNNFYKVLQKAYQQYKFKIMHFSDLEKLASEM